MEEAVGLAFQVSYNIPAHSSAAAVLLPLRSCSSMLDRCARSSAAGFLALAMKSDLLRDSGPAATGTARKPYSLSRTQAAWWFFLIIASYVFIGIITGDFSTTITGTVLVLLGISAGTYLGLKIPEAK